MISGFKFRHPDHMGYSDIEKKREYQRIWLANRRSKWFEGKSCVTCGSMERLELDHIDPKEKVTHRIWSWSWARIEKEAAKCQVLCRECHIAKCIDVDIPTRLGMAINQHGTQSMYSKKGCRCDLCKEAHRLDRAKYPRKK